MSSILGSPKGAICHPLDVQAGPEAEESEHGSQCVFQNLVCKVGVTTDLFVALWGTQEVNPSARWEKVRCEPSELCLLVPHSEGKAEKKGAPA